MGDAPPDLKAVFHDRSMRSFESPELVILRPCPWVEGSIRFVVELDLRVMRESLEGERFKDLDVGSLEHGLILPLIS